jgi:plasmid maintenance system antidote protein VapI
MLSGQQASMLSVQQWAPCKLAFMNDTEKPAFGQRLVKALVLAKKERKDLAAHLGVSVQSIGQVINGPTVAMTAENAARSARFLGVSTFWLATGEGSPMEVRAGINATNEALFIGQLVTLFQKLSPDEQHEHLIQLNRLVDRETVGSPMSPFAGVNRRQHMRGHDPERRSAVQHADGPPGAPRPQETRERK